MTAHTLPDVSPNPLQQQATKEVAAEMKIEHVIKKMTFRMRCSNSQLEIIGMSKRMQALVMCQNAEPLNSTRLAING